MHLSRQQCLQTSQSQLSKSSCKNYKPAICIRGNIIVRMPVISPYKCKRNYQIIYISSTTQTKVRYCNHLIRSCLEEEQMSSTGQNTAALRFLRAPRMLMRIPVGDMGASRAWQWNIPHPENRGPNQLVCTPDQMDEHTGGKTQPYEQWATELHDELPTFLKNYKGGQQNSTIRSPGDTIQEDQGTNTQETVKWKLTDKKLQCFGRSI